jgi:hypothetical protein
MNRRVASPRQRRIIVGYNRLKQPFSKAAECKKGKLFHHENRCKEHLMLPHSPPRAL